MFHSPAAPVDATEEESDFKVFLDTGDVMVIRRNGVYVCQVQCPIDLGELAWQLATVGFVFEETIAFPEGVVEMKLRPLGAVPGELTENEPTTNGATSLVTQKESIHA